MANEAEVVAAGSDRRGAELAGGCHVEVGIFLERWGETIHDFLEGKSTDYIIM
jgi:hypothetical protein